MLRYVAKLQNWSNYNELHRFDVKTIKTFELGRKTTKVILLRWISIDLTSKRSKTLRCLHRFDAKHQNNVAKLQKTIKTDQITMNCIDLTSKRSKLLSYVAKHSKQRIKLQWIASIWCQNYQNYAKLQKWSYYDEFASIWRQNDQKCWGTSQNIQNNAKLQNCFKLQWSNYNEFASIWRQNDQKMLSYVVKHSKQRKTTKVIKLQWIASIWRQNDQNCWVTSQNYKSDQITMHCIDLTSKRSKQRKTTKWSNYNALHRFDVITIKTTLNYKNLRSNYNEFASIWRQNYQKCWGTSQNYKTDQITMNCIDLTSKRSKLLS